MEQRTRCRTFAARLALLPACFLAASALAHAQAPPSAPADTAALPERPGEPYSFNPPPSCPPANSPDVVPIPPSPPGPPPVDGAASGLGGGLDGSGSMGMGMGRGGMGMMGLGSFVGPVAWSGGYQGAEYFNAPVRQQDAHLGYYQQSLSVLAPLWQDGPDALVGTAHVGVTSFDTNAILPDTRRSFPAELWNVGLGLNYRHAFDNGWLGTAGVSVGSPSDVPFDNINDMSFTVNATLRIPSCEHNAWIFGVFLSSNSQVLPFLPIPSVAYFYNPSPTFMALVGFPFANIVWRPTEDWTVSASYAILTNFRAQVSYRVVRKVFVFAAVDFQEQSYYLADRTDLNERFFMYDDRVYGGLRVVLSHQASITLSSGYVFGRTFFQSTNGTSASTDRVDVAPGAFLGAAFQLRY